MGSPALRSLTMTPRNKIVRPTPLLLLLATFVAASALGGCAARYPDRDPTGERFPTVRGTALDDTPWIMPDGFAGKPVLLLVGYEQATQFDLDRWLLALHDADVEVAVYELPTIPGMIPGMWAGMIDDGMRRGIPREDWAVVITVYDDAKKVAEFTGNTNRMPGRVLLLGADGRVVYFHDRGFSVGAFQAMRDALKAADLHRQSAAVRRD